MKRVAYIAAVCLVAPLGVGVSSVQAQVLPADDSKMYVELNVGPTLGHKSDKFFGVEGGYRLTGDLDVFAEFTHMGNVATTDLDNRAALIANFLGGTATTAFKVNAGVVGLKYNLTISPMVHPYVLAGVGIANVKTEVEFNVGGSTIDPAANGVQLGGDLSGSANKTILVFGFGVRVPFKTRFFGDLGYRYGQIFAKTDNFENDTSIPTQRVILGVGVKF
jgi:opacity protein-like surface antigen